MNNASYGKLTAGIVAAWFVFAVSASSLNLFKTDPSLPPIAIGLAAFIPVVVFLLWFATSQGFREFALSLSPRTLTFVQSWRIVGFTFLVLYASGILPGFFALPAGWGDIAIGATAPLVATRLVSFGRRGSFILWQIAGIFDLVLAVALGALNSILGSHGVTTAVMAGLPLSLIPTFAVPLLIMLHIICIAQATHWKQGQSWLAEQQLHSSL
jgi:hypothetical protein